MKTNEEIQKLSAKVAHESWKDFNHVYCDYLAEAADDDNDTTMDGCEIYLYVRSNGDWLIEHAQYVIDHRNIVAAIPLQLVNGPNELAEQIEQDWDEEDDENGN